MVDAAFNGSGKVAGLEGWRIENLAPVKLPEVVLFISCLLIQIINIYISNN